MVDARRLRRGTAGYHVVDEAFWADAGSAYSVRQHDSREFETRVEANLEWEKTSKGCPMVEEYGSHSWIRIPGYAHPDDYEFCWWCESRRQYDHEHTRFVYDYQGVLAPQIRQDALRYRSLTHGVARTQSQ